MGGRARAALSGRGEKCFLKEGMHDEDHMEVADAAKAQGT